MDDCVLILYLQMQDHSLPNIYKKYISNEWYIMYSLKINKEYNKHEKILNKKARYKSV